MLIVAIDTSTPTLVTGLVRADDPKNPTTLAQRIVPNCREQEELLVPCIQDCLVEAGIQFDNIDAIVVGCGPGPFTGLRVGMATSAALGDALGIPVHGVCSLDAIAARIDAPTVLVTTDARRREVYWALYQDCQRIDGPAVNAPGSLSADVHVVNVPAHLADKVAVPGERVDLDPTPEALVQVAELGAPPQPLVPLYLRRPDVKEPTLKPVSPAVPGVVL